MKPAAITDRARVLAAFPETLVEAAVLLEAVLSRAHIERGVIVCELPAWLIDRLAAWGAGIEDVEEDCG